MEHTSGFRPPGRDVTHAKEAKRAQHDHAARRYQRHINERFKARQAETDRADLEARPEQDADGGQTP